MEPLLLAVILLVIGTGLLVAEAVLQGAYFAGLKPDIITLGNGGGGPEDAARVVTFALGDVTSTGGSIEITYRAVVLNILDNQDGIQLQNGVHFVWAGGDIGPESVQVQVVEPELQIESRAMMLARSTGRGS